MFAPRRWSLSVKIAIPVGLGFFALFAILAMLSLRAVDEATDRIFEERRALTVQAAADVDSFLEQAFYELEKATTFAPFDPKASDLSAETHLLAHAYGRIGSFALGVTFLDAQGKVVLSEPYDPGLIGTDFSTQPHITEALRTGERTVSQPHKHLRTGKATVALTVPIHNQRGEVIGLLSGLIDTMNSPLGRGIEVARRLGNTGHAEVVNQNLTVVASTDADDVLLRAEHPEFYARMLRQGSTAVESTPYGDEHEDHRSQHIMAFAPVWNAPWGVAMGGDEQETLAPVYRLRQGLFWLAAVSLVVLLALTLFATRHLLRPLGTLTHAAERITAGDLGSPINLRAESELAVLAASLETMRAKLASSLAEIKSWNRDLEERVTERTRALERRNRELAISAAVAATVSAAYSLEDVLQRALDTVMPILGLDLGAIRLVDAESGDLVLHVHRGLPEHYVQARARVAQDGCYCARVCSSRSPLVLSRRFEQRPEERGCGILPICCLAVIPLESKNRLQGLLYVGSNDCEIFEQAFGADGTSLLESIGHQLGVAIENALLYEELHRKEEHRRHLLERVIAAQEDERKRIARELHDETGQALTALMMNLEAIQDGLPQGHLETRAQLERMEAILTRAIDEIRTIILDLRPTALDDLGLVPALRRYAESHLEPAGVTVQIESANLPGRLPAQLETVLFRIVQEAINNISRHAAASAVKIGLAEEDDRVVVEVSDDGRGFDPAELPRGGGTMRGLGLLGIEERAAMVGGRSRIISKPGKGTRVVVELPIVASEVPA